MSHTLARWNLGAALTGAAMLAAWILLADARADADKPLRDDAPPARKGAVRTKARPAYFGVDSCSSSGCHGDGTKPKWLPRGKAICRCDEAKRWKEDDRHGYAYESLTGPRGKRMGKLLGYGDDPKTWKSCLTCHAVWIDKKDEKAKTASFKLAEGVSCASCHGAYRDWVVLHSNEFDWAEFRKLDRKSKWRLHGMRDLWDPLERAALCASCHVGNAGEGKTITHEMYAAGHPPLPGFELGAYTRGMPLHWQRLRDKKLSIAQEQGYQEGDLEATQDVLVGAAVSFRESMALLVHDPLEDAGLDWAHLDCQSCHHDLQSPSWRQERYMERVGGKGKAKLGRVAMRSWSPELVRLAIQALPPAEARAERVKFAALMADLHAGFQGKAFGDPAVVKKAAGALEGFADALARKLCPPTRFVARDARTLLSNYPEIFATGTRLIDFDASRQIVWSFRSIRDELLETTKRPADKELTARLQILDKVLRLDMTKKVKGEKLEESYKETAESAIRYDPRKGKDALRGLRLPFTPRPSVPPGP